MNNQSKKLPLRSIILMIFFIVVIPFLPLLISRQWDWWEAWVYAIIGILGFIISRWLAARRNPDILAERARSFSHENTQSWDRVLSPLAGFGGGMILLVAGLDALFQWSPPFSTTAKLLALGFLLAGYALGSYALIENRFFSGTVRIQSDRDHSVISSGPYRWMRHPGYVGALLTYISTPIFLDSYWAFIPALFLVVVLVIRTRLEDRFLQGALEGYRDYSQVVCYRLIPGVW